MPPQIKMINVGTRLIMREFIDRSGPALHIAMTDKNAFRLAVNQITGPSDVEIVDGGFTRLEDFTASPIAMFINEADAIAFLASKGAGFQINPRDDIIDGFNWIVQVAP